MIYQGSKSRVAERIFSLLYQFACSDDCNVHFYDLFGGGGSMSQYALKYTKWHVHYNELRASTLNAFRQEITGDWQYRWVSREDFKKGNITDLERIIWSFGNDELSYIYGNDIEDFKRAVWACCFGIKSAGFSSNKEAYNALCSRVFKTKESEDYTIDFSEEKIFDLLDNYNVVNRFKLRNCKQNSCKIQSLESLESLQRLQSLQSLQSLESLQRITLTNEDYRNIHVGSNAIIYCDPPYRNTKGYGVDFDFKAFDAWALARTAPLFVSEYSDINGLTQSGEFVRRGLSSNVGAITPNEKLFTNRKPRTLF